MNRSLELVVEEHARRGRPPRHWADMGPAERREYVEALGHPAYRAGQLSAHYFAGLRDDPGEWTDLPIGMRETFAEKFMPRLLTPIRDLSCDGDTTVKTLWRMYDGALVECVFGRYRDRVTMCISSQAGCGMACPFCATGQAALQRNMSTAEIVEQVMDGERKLRRGRIPGGSGRVGNVVFMGMGEPLANYKAVLGAVRQLITPTPDGLGLSARGITVSTVGLVPRMQQLATEGLPVTLALSLHAPDDELRDELVPLNTRWNVDEVVDAAWAYARTTKRRVSIEYAL